MAQIRHEIYNDYGLVKVEFIEVEEPTIEEQIAEKEAKLLEMFEQLQKLKNSQG